MIDKELKEALDLISLDLEVKQIRFNPLKMDNETLQHLPNGYSFVCNGIKFVVDQGLYKNDVTDSDIKITVEKKEEVKIIKEKKDVITEKKPVEKKPVSKDKPTPKKKGV